MMISQVISSMCVFSDLLIEDDAVNVRFWHSQHRSVSLMPLFCMLWWDGTYHNALIRSGRLLTTCNVTLCWKRIFLLKNYFLTWISPPLIM